MFGDSREDCLRKVVPLEQMAEVEDRRLVRDRVAAEFQAGERAHRMNVVERFLRTRIGQSIPLLQAVDAQHDGKRKREPASLWTALGIMRLDHGLELRPRHDCRHLRKERLTLSALLLGRVIQRREAQLVHRLYPRESMASVCHVRRVDQRFPKAITAQATNRFRFSC